MIVLIVRGIETPKTVDTVNFFRALFLGWDILKRLGFFADWRRRHNFVARVFCAAALLGPVCWLLPPEESAAGVSWQHGRARPEDGEHRGFRSRIRDRSGRRREPQRPRGALHPREMDREAASGARGGVQRPGKWRVSPASCGKRLFVAALPLTSANAAQVPGKVFCGTWNVNGKKLEEEDPIEDWIPVEAAAGLCDIYAIGFQGERRLLGPPRTAAKARLTHTRGVAAGRDGGLECDERDDGWQKRPAPQVLGGEAAEALEQQRARGEVHAHGA
eukprot:scaffold935_cov248-Pinguiococcus_pyrenoidosus.AAC.9